MGDTTLKKLSIITLFTLILTACGTSNSSDNNDVLQIYTSIYPLQYIVEEIGADQVHTESIIPPGVDAHTYEPTSKEITELADGDAFIYIGAGMKGFAETMANAIKKKEKKKLEMDQE